MATVLVVADKWMVFGAHFDIAPPVNGGVPTAHLLRTYGTRVGAYDNRRYRYGAHLAEARQFQPEHDGILPLVG